MVKKESDAIMGLEIERKYLVKHDLWKALFKPQGVNYRQGYLLSDKEKTIRVRATDLHGFITIKGKTTGLSRLEYEYQIPLSEAIELLDTFTQNNIDKIRYKIDFEGKIWEIDVFSGANEGLIVAEIELESESEKYLIPEWVDTEVTHDKRYYNSNLSETPFKNW
ncbi:CYTH domain-containing protein [Pseudarcicella hirudinis]|uniref:CYTH domain-containing protein n=1 Tax=Pseudarcicella hirudinis TaxID=1079859 RepID=A0A1I5UIU8_9BACT|nr:CYTH domain-containing protein [Pseudarcicella hirudinis]SFP94546.1 CYTH domain-containing protein [Pseudarcicella hirudinis]